MDYEKLKEKDPEGYIFVRKCEKLDDQIMPHLENEENLIIVSVLTRILALIILTYEDSDKAYNHITMMIHQKVENEKFRAPVSEPSEP